MKNIITIDVLILIFLVLYCFSLILMFNNFKINDTIENLKSIFGINDYDLFKLEEYHYSLAKVPTYQLILEGGVAKKINYCYTFNNNFTKKDYIYLIKTIKKDLLYEINLPITSLFVPISHCNTSGKDIFAFDIKIRTSYEIGYCYEDYISVTELKDFEVLRKTIKYYQSKHKEKQLKHLLTKVD